MRYTSDDHRRYAFRNWLREQLAELWIFTSAAATAIW